MHTRQIAALASAAVTILASGQSRPVTYDVPFFPDAHFDPAVKTPDAVLGSRVGDAPANHAEIERVIRALAETSKRVKLVSYGMTHEGRELWYLVISSEANIARLDEIKADAARLADPRGLGAADEAELIRRTPAIAWMAYVIHGDEMSGSDASLAAAHYLAASTDEAATRLLDQLVIIIDPLMNPDGRDRCITGIKESKGKGFEADDQSLVHAHPWPSGRMNHYLFDLNRDWIFGTQPETRGRILAARDWSPHYFMESHEMGSQDTFLFQPPREPINPNVPANVIKWLPVFGREQANAFDARGWRYYTGEWNEEWYPGYSGSWGGLRGAIENLYEQANISVDGVKRADGTTQTYRESVHHQLVSTMANLATLAANREEVLKDFVSVRRANAAGDGRSGRRVFAIRPSRNASRMREFLQLMEMQGIEVHTNGAAIKADGRDWLAGEFKGREVAAGTLLISSAQPLGSLVSAMLELDPRMSDAFIAEERRELLRFGQSRLYDITAWSVPLLFGLEAMELDMALSADAQRVSVVPGARPASATPAGVAWIIDGDDDASLGAAAALMREGVTVRASDKPFSFEGKTFARGSVVIVLKDNPGDQSELRTRIDRALQPLNVSTTPISSGWGDGDLPDLGGQHFVLLREPSVAIIGREPFSPYSYGEMWYECEQHLRITPSRIDSAYAGAVDLRRYNVILLPDGGASILEKMMPTLKAWVENGGTLIAAGDSAGAIADEKGIGTSRVLEDVITKLTDYQLAVVREWEGVSTTPDAAKVWGRSPSAALAYPWTSAVFGKLDDEEAKRRDGWRTIFAPQGALVAVRLDDRSWLTSGCAPAQPLLIGNAPALVTSAVGAAVARIGVPVGTDGTPFGPMAKPKTPTVKEGEEKGAEPGPGLNMHPSAAQQVVRVSGLLWPEAADRMVNTAPIVRERVGNGQIVLFAAGPSFRGATRGTARMLGNAIVLGPGMGTSPVVTLVK